jgi:hypothetical protein
MPRAIADRTLFEPISVSVERSLPGQFFPRAGQPSVRDAGLTDRLGSKERLITWTQE